MVAAVVVVGVAVVVVVVVVVAVWVGDVGGAVVVVAVAVAFVVAVVIAVVVVAGVSRRRAVNYKGNALGKQESPEELKHRREQWRLYMRELDAIARRGLHAPEDEDDGRCDEDHPDSGWVESFNRGQRGET